MSDDFLSWVSGGDDDVAFVRHLGKGARGEVLAVCVATK